MAYVDTPAFYTAYQSRSADEQPLAVDGDLGDVIDIEIPRAGGVRQYVVRHNQIGLQGVGDLGFGFKSVVHAATQAVKQVAAPIAKVAAPVVDVAKKALTVTTMGLPLAAAKILPKAIGLVAGKPKVAADASGAVQYTDASGNPISKAQYDQLVAQYNASMAQTSSTSPIGLPDPSATAAAATMASNQLSPAGVPLAPQLTAMPGYGSPSPMMSPGGYPYGGDPYGSGQSFSDTVTTSDAYDASQMDPGTDVAASGDVSAQDDDATASDDDSLPMSGLSGPHGGGGHHGGHGGFSHRGRGGSYLPFYYDDGDGYYGGDTVIVIDERDADDDDADENAGMGAVDTGASLVALAAIAAAIYFAMRAQPKPRRRAAR